MKKTLKLYILFISLLVSGYLFAAESSVETEIDTEETPMGDGTFGLGWLDRTQAFSSTQANTLATQIDRFLGIPRSDLESAYSSLRLGIQTEWAESHGVDNSVSLRGKIFLPRINERISLIFSEDSGEGNDYYNQSQTGLNETSNTHVNLQLNIEEDDNSRLDFRIGLRSNLKLKTSARYHYDIPVNDSLLHSLTQTIKFVDGDGFGSVSQYALQKTLSEHTIVRWINNVYFEETYTGAKLETELLALKRLSDHSALSTYIRFWGQSNPKYVAGKSIGIRIRRNILRPWLFTEIGTAYSWVKEEEYSTVDGEASIMLRLEMAIGKLQ